MIMAALTLMMTGETTKTTASDTNPPPSAVFHDFLGGKAPTFSEKQVGSQLERISSHGPKSDLSVSEVSNRFAGSKRSNSDSAFTGSSREGIPQMIPESSHVMKMLRSARVGERLKISPFDGPLHGVPHHIRPLSSFVSQTTNANFVNSERSNPMNVGGTSMQYNACVMKSSPLLYQVPSSRLRDISSGPSVLSQLAADEGSRTGNKGSGILNSINAGSHPVSERNLTGLVPSGCNPKPEPSNPPSSRGPITSGSRQMTIIFGGQVHVFDDVHPNKADVIMAMAGSNGGSWSTNLPKASNRTTTNDSCLPGGEHETSESGDRSFAHKYYNLLSANANSIHGLGSINQGGIIAKAAGTSGHAIEPSFETKRETWETEVLKYKDIVLRDLDLNTVRGPCFLNDQIIAFYFSYLFSSCKTEDFLLVDPFISICLANCEDDKLVEEFAQRCRLSSKRRVLFAVNDNEDFSGGDRGNHCCILVFDRTKNSFFHYDSMEGVNNFHAMKLYDAVKEYIGPGGEVARPLTSSSSVKKQRNKKKSVQSVSKPLVGVKPETVSATAPAGLPVFMDCKTPQRTNGYDCGLYVLAIAREICQWYSHGNSKSNMQSAIEEHADDSVEVNLRSEVLEIIQELNKN